MAPFEFGYGYNALGTLWKDPIVPLGLSPIAGELRDADGKWTDPASKTLGVSASSVRVPSEMIAIGDFKFANFLSHIHPHRHPVGHLVIPAIADIHSRGANVVFCDGHVEYAKQSKWKEESESVRRRWNNDHEPHPETW